ncbi:MAG: hypothetical protein K2M87_03590 [Muribaculaceae bacterium]|nr:hypothetical protein [Muribaculaceae bacterium]
MEENKLKSLFSDFNPELSSDFRFMNNLRRNLESVEIIKLHSAELRARHKKALILAAIVGFVVGFLFSLSLPYLNHAVSNWQLYIPSDSILNTLANNYLIIAWLVIGGTSVTAAINTYELSLSLFKTKDMSSQ